MAEGIKKFGGLDEDFVDAVADTFLCQICAKPLRDPHITKCCGHNFCESCLEKWSKTQREPCCPLCRSVGDEFQHFLDKKTKRAIDTLKVRCSNHKKGCEWIGEKGALRDHLDSKGGCGYVEVECPLGCYSDGYSMWSLISLPKQCHRTTVLLRNNLQHHVEKECKKRKYQCEHCGEKDTFDIITTFHYPYCGEVPLQCPNKCCVEKIKRKHLNEHLTTCPLQKIGCPFVEEGCDAKSLLRKDEAEHLEKNVVKHQLLMLKTLKERKKTEKNQEIKGGKREREWKLKSAAIVKNLDSLVLTCTNDQILPLQSIRSLIDDSYCVEKGKFLVLTMKKFFSYKRNKIVWYSPPFYMGDIAGLKLRLAVYANGIQSGANTHTSLIVQNLKRDVEEPTTILCGLCVHVSVKDRFVCETAEFCELDTHEYHNEDGAKGLHYEYQFIPHSDVVVACDNDTLKLTVSLLDTDCPYDNL